MVYFMLNGYDNALEADDLSVCRRVLRLEDGRNVEFGTLSRRLKVSEVSDLDEDSRERLSTVSKYMYRELNFSEWPPCQEGFEVVFSRLLVYFEYDEAYKELIFMLSKTLESLYYGYCRVITESFWGSDKEFYEKYRGNGG